MIEETLLNFIVNNGVGAFGMYLMYTLVTKQIKAQNDKLAVLIEKLQQNPCLLHRNNKRAS